EDVLIPLKFDNLHPIIFRSNSDIKTIASENIVVVRTKPDISNSLARYIRAYFLTNIGIQSVIDLSKPVTKWKANYIKISDLKSLVIKVPSKDRQLEIAESLENAIHAFSISQYCFERVNSLMKDLI
ncbi:MAG: hypothetical protein AAGA83_00190, partial [Cyanobacteria bacterium P01_F01_bin.116]